MLAPVQSALKTKLATVVADWPIRWSNEAFASGVLLSTGGLPVDGSGAAISFIDAEIIGGKDDAAIGPAGSRASRVSGLFRLYLSVAQGSGTDAIDAKADAIASAFKRVTVFTDTSLGQRLLTMDPRIDDNVASYEDATRFVRQISIPWNFDYVS